MKHKLLPIFWIVFFFFYFFLRTFFTLALPSLFQICLEWWIIEIILLIVGTLPNSEIVQAASISFNYTEVLIIMVYIGLNTAASVRVGNFIGANKPQRAKVICFAFMYLNSGVQSFAFGIQKWTAFNGKNRIHFHYNALSRI